MPIYEYECQICGHQFEIIQKVGDSPLILCPECGKNGLRKRISQTSFRLKGEGWYETDFKSSKKSEKGVDKPNAKEGETK